MDENKALAEDIGRLQDEMSYRGKAHQQLVTDEDGKAQWEDQLAYGEQTEISWDGDTADRAFFTYRVRFYKVSDLTPTIEELIGGTFISSETEERVTITQDIIRNFGDSFLVGNDDIIVIPRDDLNFDGHIIPEKGIYMSHTNGAYPNSLIYTRIKPLEYNYMPEGYPSKKLKSGPIVDELEVTFQDIGVPFLIDRIGIGITARDKLTVIWDGESYDVILREIAPHGLVFGNLGLLGVEGYQSVCPFAGKINIGDNSIELYSNETEESHTITIILYKVFYTPIDQNFLQSPKNLNVIFTYFTNENRYTCNVEYSQLRDWYDRGLPIFAICKVIRYNEIYETLIMSSYELNNSNRIMVFSCSGQKSGTLQLAYHENGVVTKYESEPS